MAVKDGKQMTQRSKATAEQSAGRGGQHPDDAGFKLDRVDRQTIYYSIAAGLPPLLND
jgi:hypothetical protein